MPLTGAEYRRVIVSQGIARAQSELAACDPRRLRGHRDHHERVKHADDGAGRAPNGSPFDGDFQKRRPTPASKKALKPRRCCLTLAFVVRLHRLRRDCLFRHAAVNPQGPERFYKGPSDPKKSRRPREVLIT
jgi:hypothetical protein